MPESSAIAVMKKSANHSRCKYKTQFQQRPVVEYAKQAAPEFEAIRGLCNGLSLSWLKQEAALGPNTLLEDLKRDTKEPKRPNSHKRLRALHYLQRDFQTLDDYGEVAGAQAILGLMPRRGSKNDDGTTSVKRKYFHISEKEDVKRLASWFGETTTRRYFVISTGRHAMAATGSKFGKLKFFDANAGVVSTTSKDSMADFLWTFMNDESIEENYFAGMLQKNLQVYKFSARPTLDVGRWFSFRRGPRRDAE